MVTKSFLELCQSGTPDEVRQAIKDESNLEEVDQIDRTGLMLAVLYNEDAEVSRVLVEAGSPLDHFDVSDMSALHYAVEYSRTPDLVELLLKAGSNVNTRSIYNRSVLMTAAAFNHPVVPLLLSFGADPKAIDEEGLNAVMLNIYFNYDKDVVECLFKAGTDPNYKDAYDRDWNDYMRIFVTDSPVSGKKDLAPQRVDLVPVFTLSEDEAKKKAAWGVSPSGEPYWVEQLNEEGSYTIHYRVDGEPLEVQASGLSASIDFCIPFHFPSSWILASCGEVGFFQDESRPNLFILDESGKELSSFYAGNAIESIIPCDKSFWVLYNEELESLGNNAWLVEWNSSGKVIGVFRHGDKDDGYICVSVCKEEKDLYAMFEPGTFLVKANTSRTYLECHQSFSAMAIKGNKALMKESLHIHNLLYEYEIIEGGIELKRRFALYSRSKALWDYDFKQINHFIYFNDTYNLFSITLSESSNFPFYIR